MKLNKKQHATDLLGIFLGAKAGAGPQKTWASLLRGLLGLGAMHAASYELVSCCFPSNSHLPTVAVFIHSVTTAQWRFRRTFAQCYHMQHELILMFNSCLNACPGQALFKVPRTRSDTDLVMTADVT